MPTQVEASTVQAGQLFSTSKFRIPEFQREYRWKPNDEAQEFWNDLKEARDSPPYFLGLLIFTEQGSVKTVVDGQQRLITLTLLANAIRKAALKRGRRLVADSMRDVFLFSLDYHTEERSPRIHLTSQEDRDAFEALLAEGVEEKTAPRSRLTDVQRLLDKLVEDDLSGHDVSLLGKWALFLTNGITFAVFEHPDQNAAYKVYEIVNTRGKDLTPAELIKSYVIGSFASDSDTSAYERWTSLERPFAEIGASTQFTQFIRHVVTLKHGYVIPRDLYQVITSVYEGNAGVNRLFEELEDYLDLYLQIVDPSSAASEQDDYVLKSFAILEALSLSTVRPVFLALSRIEAPHEGLERLIGIIVPRIVTGTFGTGSVERLFASAARMIAATGQWREALETLKELAPESSDFFRQLQGRQSKGLLLVLRNSLLQRSKIPSLDGHLHFVRPGNAESWPDFDDQQFKEVGATLGNVVLSKEERRPRGTNTWEGARERLLPTLLDVELEQIKNAAEWSAISVVRFNAEAADDLVKVWYGPQA